MISFVNLNAEKVRSCQPESRTHQHGVALFVGLVFLVILSLVALVAMRGTLLDMRLTSATARHEQAFEASEAAREIPEAVMANHIFYRGWPAAWGGTVPDAQFGLDTIFAGRLAWVTLLAPNGLNGLQSVPTSCGSTAKVSFYLPTTCSGQTEAYNYAPTGWYAAFIFSTCADGSTGSGTTCSSGNQIKNTISIVRDGVSLTKGAGAAQAQGYSSVGVGSSKGGSALFLQVRSDSKVAGNGESATIAQYQLSINH